MTIALPNPVLAGSGYEPWADDLDAAGACGALRLWRRSGELWGLGHADVAAPGFHDAARTLYRDLFRASGDRSLYRIWNFIPRINDSDGGLENYRAFCEGRHLAFAEHFGPDSEPRMPAATAVGTDGCQLCVVFVAGPAPVRYVENPYQVPAYHYPPRYGPRSPSFARASLLDRADGRLLYVSGTASIRGSESLHRGDLSAQLALALDNVDAVARAAGFRHGLTAASPGTRRFRIYLRHRGDWPAARDVLQARLLRDGDVFNAVQADICRRDLLIELEAAVADSEGSSLED